jgi:ATP-dependent helicase/nuclease subunit B
LRDAAGLRLPDRVIGLSAHDFQQAVAAPEVWLCRARRDAETDTVPSRWLNRLTNLLGGERGVRRPRSRT